MLRILHGTKYDFIRPWRIAVAITAVFIVAGLGFLAVHGINKSIEFTGGTLMQLEFQQPPNPADLRATVDGAGYPGSEIQPFGSPREFTVRAAGHDAGSSVEKTAREIEIALHKRFGATEPTVVRTEIVGARVGDELSRNALIAIVISLFVTLLYLAFRFEWRFGVAAVLATAHDLLSTLAFLAIMRLEVSLTVVAALLTVIGYSLNDTIIIFDRVRENLKKARPEPLYDVLNRSINETLPRSVLTHVTVAAATLSLLIFAGEVIRPFSWIMLFGIVTGTFSSVYIAGPTLLWIERKWPRARGNERAPSRAPAPVAPVKPAASRPPVAARTR
ncbi:MAG: protein translocase subunit SecF [Polaromonas sp.]|nr:protein translocase subunit SecF [Gemmatimonadaceae bacterium]